MGNIKDNEKTYLVKIVAELTGKTPDLVYKALRNDRNNNEVCALYDDLKTGFHKTIESLQENPLMNAVKSLQL